MTGLLPTARERRSTTLTKKRNEYWKLVDRYFKLRVEDNHKVGFFIKWSKPKNIKEFYLIQKPRVAGKIVKLKSF